MTTNQYFNNYSFATEQGLIEDLIIESIQMYGLDMYYLPRTTNVISSTWNESTLTSFNSYEVVEMYIRNVDGFAGDGEFLSKFGVEVRDQVTFTVAQSRWNDVSGGTTLADRPKEGDCIYFPLTGSLFQIKFVNVKAIFYQLGALQTYDLTCELYEGNSDTFNTGITTIDNKYNALSISTDTFDVLTEDGKMMLTEDGQYIIMEEYSIEEVVPIAQNDIFVSEGADFIDFTEIDPFSERASF